MKDKIILYATLAIAVVAVIMFMIYPVVFYTLIGVAAFLGIVYLCTKYKWARIATSIAMFLALGVGTVYSFVNLNEYYTATGGVFGRISDFFGTNTVEVEDLKFNFSDIQLKDSGNQTDYTAQYIKNVAFDFDHEKNYSVYVNGVPCTFVEITQNYIRADFTYQFQDDDLSELMTDTLKFRFAIYKNYTEFNVTTSGGQEAVNRWNFYFKKNGFSVEVKETKYHSTDMKQVDGSEEYVLAEYYVKEQKYLTQAYQIGAKVTFPELPSDEHYIGWGLGGLDALDNYTIYQDTKFYSIPFDTSFSDATWLQIADICQRGKAETVFNVGDEKTFELTTGEQITVVILGFNHDDLTSGGKASISIGMKDCLTKTYRMNSSDTNVGGWDKSEMRTRTLSTLFYQLPADLQKVIKPVDKITTNGGGSSSLPATATTTSSDKLWLLSFAEIFSKASIENSAFKEYRDNAATYETEGHQYAYFKNLIGDNNGGTSGNDALIKNLSNGKGDTTIWWLRSPHIISDCFHCIGPLGNFDVYNCEEQGVSFGFCI